MIYNETRYNSHWNTKKLSDLGVFARGKSKHRPRDDERLYEGGGYPLIQTGEVKAANLYITKHEQEYGKFGLAQSKLWDAGTLCITIAANIAETAILSYPMCFPDSVVGFRAFPEESSELFMHYVFTYIRNSIQNSVSGSIQDNINIDYLSQLDFKVPDKAYQDKVVDILGTIDQKIDNNNRMGEALESMAKTIYDYWFTQFDFPDADGKPYRSSGGAMVWNEQLKCKIPQSWGITSVGNVTRNHDSKRIPLSQNERDSMKGDIPYYGATGIMDYVNRHIFDDHYVLIAEDGSVMDAKGNPIVQMIWGKTWVNNHAHVLEGCNGYSNELLYLLLHHIPVVKIMTGSIQKKINQDNLNNYRIPQIPESIATAFSEIVKPLFEQIRVLQRENEELTKLRNWLLPMLMNGQATVADAEEEVSKVIPFEPRTVEVRQAARNFVDKKIDDTADLVKAYMRRKKDDQKP